MQQPMKVAIVDDDPVVGAVIEAIARSAGATTRLWHEPHEFLRRVACEAPSHIVLDMHMPGMDGAAVLGELASQQCRARIVLVSGDPFKAEVARQRWQDELDIVGVLPKPFRAARLRALLA